MLSKLTNLNIEGNDTLLLKKFNNRESDAFAEIYIRFYDKLFYFTSKLYAGTEVIASDKIQDLFLKLWENKKTIFVSISHIKSYLYLSIQNSFREYLSHNAHVSKYAKKVVDDHDFYTTEIIETETMSTLYEFIDKLPESCGDILKLYIMGWDIKEIANRIGKPQSTIYRQKEKAISILSDKLPKELFVLIINILS